MPALEAFLVLEQRGLRRRVVALEPLEPGNPGVAVALLPSALSGIEMRPKLLRVGFAEAERAQPAEALVSVHVSSKPGGPPRPRGRPPRREAGCAVWHAGRRGD